MNMLTSLRPSRILLTLLSVLLVLFLFRILTSDSITKVNEMEEQVSQLDIKIKELRKENSQLKETILNIKKDDYLVEKIAREDLGLVKDDEVVYRLYQ